MLIQIRLLLLVVIFLQFCTTIVSASSFSRVNYQPHAEHEREQPGRSGEPPVFSVHLLKNRCSHRFVRLMPRKKIDAFGLARDKYSELQFTSASFDGLLYIQNKKTQRYLCFNKGGKLKLKHTKDDQCIFKEIPTTHGYRYQSDEYPKYFLGYNKNGKKLKGKMPKSKRKQRCYTFLKSGGPRAINNPGNERPGPDGVFWSLAKNTTGGPNIRHSRRRHRRRDADVT